MNKEILKTILITFVIPMACCTLAMFIGYKIGYAEAANIYYSRGWNAHIDYDKSITK